MRLSRAWSWVSRHLISITRPPRVWNWGDPKPLGHPLVTDRHGRLFRWDPDLMNWIHERRDGSIKTGCRSWELLVDRHGPLSER